MTINDILLLVLRVAHASAAVVWVGGGVYFTVGILPILRSGEPIHRSVALAAQRGFADWSRDATIVLLATGMILMFDRLSSGVGGLTYAAILGVKVVSAVLAFVAVAGRWHRRMHYQRVGLSTTQIVMILGWTAFLLGVGLAAVYGRGFA